MKKTFSWITIYKDLAQKILDYKNNRQELLSLLFQLDSKFTGYLREEDKSSLEDICPFTVMGMFNRGVTLENRVAVITGLQRVFGLEGKIPSDFYGIPVLNNLKSHFFGYKSRRGQGDIDNLWALFEAVMTNQDDQVIGSKYNLVIEQFCIKNNITMGLFWIAPERFLALDGINRGRLQQFGIRVKSGDVPVFGDYMEIMVQLKEQMGSSKLKETTFYEFSYEAWLASQTVKGKIVDSAEEVHYQEVVDLLKYKKNIILQGAPGVGKTYDVPEIVARLCDPNVAGGSRSDIEAKYKELVKSGQVVFTTFHQSLDYEEFVEGIRPEVENDAVSYNVRDGIFKRLCEQAQTPIVKNDGLGIGANPTIWKVSLASTYGNPVRTDCLKSGKIRIGWDEYGEDLTCAEIKNGGNILNAFVSKMKVGDIVVSCYSNQVTDAIGVVESDYYYDDNYDQYKRVRNVKWLAKDINENIYELNNNTQMTLSTVYRLNNLSLSKIMGLLEKYGVDTGSAVAPNTKPYILVIDEINRGNVSKIFGELITLLEADKRIEMGSSNSGITVRLPYSCSEFGVPDNVYIIGTMNTADRSLGYIDYAIRRRFAFIDTKPVVLPSEIGFDEGIFRMVAELFIANYDEYVSEGKCRGDVELVPSSILSPEYRPEDVWLGHSYFIMSGKGGVDITKSRIKYEIVPILKEYIKDGIFKNEAAVFDVINSLNND